MNANNMNSRPDPEDAPLDPAVEKVRRKVMRLMGISVAIMMIGLMAVIGAIFYKISGTGNKNISVSGETIDLPDGSTVINTDFSNGQILLSVKSTDGKLSLWVYDVESNRVLTRIVINE